MTKNKTSFLANEPVVVGAVVTWLFSVLGTFLLGHTNLITSADWSTLSTFLVPVISAAVIGAVTKFLRDRVTPAWKVVTRDVDAEATKLGIPDDLLNKLVSQGVERELGKIENVPALRKLLEEIENAVVVKPAA